MKYVGYPIPGTTTIYDTSERLDLDTVPLNGGVLAKLVVLSIDPYLRNTIKGNAPVGVSSRRPLDPLFMISEGIGTTRSTVSNSTDAHTYVP